MFSIIVFCCPLFLTSLTIHAFTSTSPTIQQSLYPHTKKAIGKNNRTRRSSSSSSSSSTVSSRRRVVPTVGLKAKDENMSPEERVVAMDKALKAMTAFSNKYVENTGTYYCADKSIPAVVIKGLAEHKVTLGAPLCPCRFYEDKEKEAQDGYWNCPCVPMRERHECHCMLFLIEDNDFVGTDKNISFDEVQELSAGFGT